METLKTVVVTGAGSGVGRACVTLFASHGWRVALIGRREETLRESVTLAKAGSSALICPCDIADSAAVATIGKKILAEFGGVEVLVNAAGTNAPRRSLEVLSLEDYHAMIGANLNGAYYCVQAFLADMRRRKSGTIVNVVSEAGRQASPKSGPAYVMSKFGMTGLTQSINAEERANGVRACAVFPGDIDTPLLDKRPSPPPAEARTKMLTGGDVAECVWFACQMPSRALVEEILIRPR